MKLIAGLGNPGKKYLNTRHNIGFALLDFIYNEWLKNEGFSEWTENKKFHAEISEGRIGSEKIILAKPTTFMNNSGSCISAIATFHKIKPQDIIIIHDELDLPLGKYKIQSDRSSAGHRGVTSIIQMLGSQNFLRVRAGIAKEDKSKQGATEKFVLNKFNLFEKLKLKSIKEKILDELKNIIAK
ncbi:aminoacyl-tRNA hydrolase [Patescibacteria group bacterium]|nr:aminoacyl-tRNA hydrolase [Patescibacteria group bacterium]